MCMFMYMVCIHLYTKRDKERESPKLVDMLVRQMSDNSKSSRPS